MALVFPAGRPGREELTRLGAAGPSGLDFAVTADLADENACEVVALGLAFDVRGLGTGAAEARPAAGALVGLAELPPGDVLTIEPAPNVISDPLMVPVLRALVGIAARIAADGAAGLHWSPARTWMEPGYFARAADAWLAGGAFPAPGLVGLARRESTLTTIGLAALTGQELTLDAAGRTPAQTAAVAVRLIHLLSESGAIERERRVTLPGGEDLLLRPVRGGMIEAVRP